MGAGEHGNPDRVRVLLNDGLHDLFRRLVQPCVDDLHAGVPQRPGDHLRAAIVPVEAGFGDDDPDAVCQRSERRWPRARAEPGG